jgi:hypothetical protein
MGKAGGCAHSHIEAASRMISLALRSGLESEAIIKQLKGIRCPEPRWKEGRMILSCADAIAHVLEKHGNFEQQINISSNVVGMCPDCGGVLEHEGGCAVCKPKVISRPLAFFIRHCFKKNLKNPRQRGYISAVSSKKEGIRATCPFCKGKLWIDPVTGDILHKEEFKKDTGNDFNEFLATASREEQILEEKFKKAQEKEKSKLERLQKKFDWAKEHPDELPDDDQIKPII